MRKKALADYSACTKEQSTWLIRKVGELPGCTTFTSAYDLVSDIVSATQPTSCEFCTGYCPAAASRLVNSSRPFVSLGN